MNIIHSLRSILNIRVERELPPPGPRPPVGSNIARENLRIRLKYPVSDEQWAWFTKMGWRRIDMRKDRRRYHSVPETVLEKLLGADEVRRDALHERLLKAYDQH